MIARSKGPLLPSKMAELALQVVVEIGAPIGSSILAIESAPLSLMSRSQLAVIR